MRGEQGDECGIRLLQHSALLRGGERQEGLTELRLTGGIESGQAVTVLAAQVGLRQVMRERIVCNFRYRGRTEDADLPTQRLQS